MKGGHFFNSGVLFKTAVTAFERLNTSPSEKDAGHNDALVAILFSAAALEAFIMELAILADTDAKLLGHKSFESVAAILDEAESSRGSIRLKFLLASFVLGGEAYDKGSHPFQDFDTLFSLRDTIVHMKPEKITGDPHKILQRLEANGLCENAEPGVTESWISRVSTRAVARWACNVVVAMEESLKESLPAELKNTRMFSFSSLGNRFKRVE